MNDPSPTTADVATVARWLHAHNLALPAWVVLEGSRPFAWLVGQLCLVAQPLARGLGWSTPLDTAYRWLDAPDALATLSEALAPDREGTDS